MNPENPISITDKFSLFNEHWQPKIIAHLNDYEFKIVKIKGEFVWHSHENTDEAFMVIDGDIGIRFRDKTLYLKPGDLYIVPKGVEHQPFAEEEAQILLIEPKDVINTGDNTSNNMTAENGVWI